MVNGAAALDEDVHHRVLALLLVLREVVLVVGILVRGENPDLVPSAGLREFHDPLDRRLGHDHEVRALGHVRGAGVEPVDDGGAAGAGRLHVRPVHVAVDDQAVLPGREQLRQLHRAHRAVRRHLLEGVIFRGAAAHGQIASLAGDRLHLLAQGDLGPEKSIPRLAIFARLVLEVFHRCFLFHLGHSHPNVPAVNKP